MRRRVSSADDVAQYLAADRIECLECGRRYAFLPSHLARAHDLDAVQYRERWGLPAGTPLAGRAYREQRSASVRAAIARGDFVPAHDAASNAARGRPRGRRVDWERRDQAERMRQHSPRQRLPDGHVRADGRNTDRARAYQRARRAAARGDRTAMDEYRRTWGRPG